MEKRCSDSGSVKLHVDYFLMITIPNVLRSGMRRRKVCTLKCQGLTSNRSGSA